MGTRVRRFLLPGSNRAKFDLLFLLIGTLFYADGASIANLFIGGRVDGGAGSSGALATTGLGTAIDNSIRIIVIILVVCVIVFRNLRSVKGRVGALGIIGLYLLTVQLTSVMATMSAATTARWWLTPILAIAIWTIGLRIGDLVVFGWATFAIALISLGMAIVDPTHAFMMLTDYLKEINKALIGDQQLAGFFPQMNVLGMSMALGFPFVFLFRRKWLRWVAAGTVFYTLLWSASRTSVLALSITCVVTVIAFSARNPNLRKWLFVAAAFAQAAVVVWLPLTTDDPSAYTNRGDIWIAARSEWAQSPIFGFGTGAFSPGSFVATKIGYPSWHGHNTFLSAFTMGGILLVVMVAILFITVWRSALALTEYSWVPVVFAYLMIAIGMTEVAFRMDDFDGVAWIAWPALLSIAVTLPGVRRPRLSTETDLVPVRREGVTV